MSKIYQWIKGDDAGKVVKWTGDIVTDESLGMNFLIFEDGTRANETLIGDFFMEIENEEDLILIPEPKGLPPENNPPMQRVFAQPASATSNVVIEKTESPMHRLLSESKKKKTTVNVAILADMPPVELMKILADSYDDGEKQVLEYIESTIDIKDIKAQISKQIWLSAFEQKIVTAPAKKTRNKTIINETA